MNTTLSLGARRAGSLLALLAVAWGCSEEPAPAPPDSAAVAAVDSTATRAAGASFSITPEQRQRIHMATVQPVAFRPLVEATGTVAFNGDRSTQILSPVSGPATRVVGEAGMNVARGQPLAYVSSPDFASAVASYRKAQTAYRNAKRIADRDSALFQNDALARGELEQAQSDVAAADADLEAAVQSMQSLGVEASQIAAVRVGSSAPIQAIIRSPIAGTVVEKLIANGQLLTAGTTPCFTVADLSSMWVMASVFANDLADVAVGQPVEIVTDASKTPVPGRVDYIASVADPGTKAVSVRIVAANSNHVLRRDLFVRVRISSAVEHHGLLVPASSVLRDEQNLPFVFVADRGGGFARRPITLGTRVGDRFEVASGLVAGDSVVEEGALFIQFAESQ
jgi:cobalt-zinc-cadmium efflux system membrane fusion protein